MTHPLIMDTEITDPVITDLEITEPLVVNGQPPDEEVPDL